MWRHAIGADPSTDVCVYHETDDSYYIGIGRSRTERLLYIHAGGWVGNGCLVGWVVWLAGWAALVSRPAGSSQRAAPGLTPRASPPLLVSHRLRRHQRRALPAG